MDAKADRIMRIPFFYLIPTEFGSLGQTPGICINIYG
jgi:hypothetical protein